MTIAYSIKNDETLTLRAFKSKRSAQSYGNGQQIFTDHVELLNSRLTENEMRRVYYAVSGFHTKANDREYLSQQLFSAIRAAGLPETDDMDMCIKSAPVKNIDIKSDNSLMSERIMSVYKEFVNQKKSNKKETLRVCDRSSQDPVVSYGVHPNSGRAIILERLMLDGQPVPIDDLVTAVYGECNGKLRGAFKFVMKGLLDIQSKHETSFVINKLQTGKEVSYEIRAR